MNIHPQAIVSPKVKIGTDVEIGPFCVIEDNVCIGDGCRLESHVTIKRGAILGQENILCSGTVIGGLPQHTAAAGRCGQVVIGDKNTFRENTTVHRAMKECDATTIGNENYFMVNAHVAHDCSIGNFNVLSGATLHADTSGNTVQVAGIQFQSGSTLSFGMAGAKDVNDTNATTNLTLGGSVNTTTGGTQKIGEGTVQVDTLYGLTAGKSYRLVATDDMGSTVDTGNLLIGTSGNGKAQLTTDSNNQYLYLKILSTARYSDLWGLRPNAVLVTGALDTLVDFGVSNPFMNKLPQLVDETLMAGAINQLPGDVFAVSQYAGANLRQNFNGLLPTWWNMYGEYVTPMTDSYRGQAPRHCGPQFWATPTGHWMDRDARSGYAGFDIGNVGAAIGVSWRLNNHSHIGLAFGYDYARLEMNGFPQRDDINAINFALYGGYVDNRQFFDYQIGYGKNFHDTSRVVAFNDFYANPTVDYDDDIFSMSLMYGHRYGMFLPSILYGEATCALP